MTCKKHTHTQWKKTLIFYKCSNFFPSKFLFFSSHLLTDKTLKVFCCCSVSTNSVETLLGKIKIQFLHKGLINSTTQVEHYFKSYHATLQV